jgi:glycosyltransferase involved in cell wall biosynthesis
MQTSNTPQKILFVITKSNWGGAQRYVYDIAISLHKEKYEVVVALGGDGELCTRLEKEGIRYITLTTLTNDMNILRSMMSLWELIVLCKREAPHVIHLNSSKIGLFGGLSARLLGVPSVIFTAHSWPFNEERPIWQIYILRKLMQVAVFLSNKTICVSKSARTTLQAPAWLEKKCLIVHNGIAPIPFKSYDAFYNDYSVEKKEDISLVSIGELHKSKGFDLALTHLAELKHLSWEWHILGEGKERDALTEQIHLLKLEDRVYLHGHVPLASTYLSSFDLFFLPSRTEGLGYVAIEALQSNLPILASNAGGIPEVLRRDSGTTFITIRNSNSVSIIEKVLRSGALPVADNARKRLREEFSFSHMIKQTKQVYSLKS